MKSISSACPFGLNSVSCEDVTVINPSLIFMFAAPKYFKDEAFLANIREKAKGRSLIGCSTSGEISNSGAIGGSVTSLGLAFARTKVRSAHAAVPNAGESFIAGEHIGRALKAPDLKAVFILGPGTNINGSALTQGLSVAVGQNVTVSGGLAGDDLNFKETFTHCDGEVYTDHAVAVGFYGDYISISSGSEGGWRPFGPARRVTKSDNHILYELDGKPALQLYKQYLGEKARELPASGLSYPLAILRQDRTTSGVIRSALNIDREKEALIMAGDIPQGSRVCLMHADTDALIQGAAQAAAEALRVHEGPEANGCALVVSCVGRKIVLGVDVDEEIEAVNDSFLPNTPITGFYSYGEICTYRGKGGAVLHNQTMTITYITEREDI